MNEPNLSVRGIVHDLNNQIMVLLFSLDRIQVLYPNEQDAKQAMRAAEHCAQLVTKLAPQRPGAEAPATVSIQDIVGDAAMLVRSILPGNTQLDVECHTGQSLSAGISELRQVLVNLCVNAIDSIHGSGKIRIIAADEVDGVSICVQDTGSEIAIDLVEAVFESAHTALNGTARSGLGLLRVRQTIGSVGGSVSVESVFPNGNCFRILLPVL